MALELAPLKVIIGKNADGSHKYPNFNTLQSVISSGQDWSNYIDSYGKGWHYDKCCGHAVDTPESPGGQRYGLLIVPREFVEEAITRFPGICQALTETECEDFYNNHCHRHEPDEMIDNEILQGIKLKQDLGITLTPEQTNALDPTNDTPGIRKNKNKKWVDYKRDTGIVIVSSTGMVV